MRLLSNLPASVKYGMLHVLATGYRKRPCPGTLLQAKVYQGRVGCIMLTRKLLELHELM